MSLTMLCLNSNNEKMIQNILNEQGNNDNFLKDDDFTKSLVSRLHRQVFKSVS
jgi:hypothetical protein